MPHDQPPPHQARIAKSADAAATVAVRTLFAAGPELDQARRPRNPYKGFTAFEPEDRADFFGRDELIARLVRRIEQHPLTTLIGPSGAGKSSLIGAGLLPRLAERGGWQILRIRPGAAPLDVLAAALVPADLPPPQRRDEQRRLTERLADTPEGPIELLHHRLTGLPDTRLLLVVDQFEELFTAALVEDPRGAARFIKVLAALACTQDPQQLPWRLVLSLRADFMDRAMEVPTAAFVAPRLQFPVRALDEDALQTAIEGPAAAQGVHISSHVVKALLAQFGRRPERLALLQLALSELWELQHARVIDTNALKAIGHVRHVQSRYDQVRKDPLDRLPEGESHAEAPDPTAIQAPCIEAEPDLCTTHDERDKERASIAADHAPKQRQRRWRPAVAAGLIVGLLALTGAALWQRQGALAEADRAARARESAEDLIRFMASDLHNKLMPIGRLDLLNDIQQRIDAYYDGQDLRTADTDEQRQRAVNLARSGDLQASLGDLGAAEQNYAAATKVFRRLAAEAPSDADRQRDLSVGLNQVGTTKAAQGDLAGALAAYQESQSIRERLATEDPSNAGWQRDLAVSRNKVGDIKSTQGDLSGALSAYEGGQAIFRRLADAEPGNADWRRNLSVNLNKIGDVKAAQGDLAAALIAYQEGQAIFKRLAAADPSNAGRQRDLSASLIKAGDIQAAQGDLTAALTAYQEGQEIFARLADANPSNLAGQRDLSVSLLKIGEIKLAQRDLRGALKVYEAGQKIFARLTNADPDNAGWQRDLAVSLNEIGDVRSALGDLVEALAAYQEGEETFRRLSDADPSNAELQRDLAVSLISTGTTKAAQGDLPGALADYRESKAIVERLTSVDPNNAQWQTDVVTSLWKISDIPLVSDEERKILLQRALAILEQLAAAGRLQGFQREWPNLLRARLETITPEAKQPASHAQLPATSS